MLVGGEHGEGSRVERPQYMCLSLCQECVALRRRAAAQNCLCDNVLIQNFRASPALTASVKDSAHRVPASQWVHAVQCTHQRTCQIVQAERTVFLRGADYLCPGL